MASMDIGIDLGTANIIINMRKTGIVLNEPSVVAFNKKTEQVVAVGEDAYKMLGRTPGYIVAVKPLTDGVISDDNMTQTMIKEFIRKVCGKQLIMPRIIICVPSLITEVESRAVVEAARNAGARKVYLIEEPIAAILGAGVDISKPDGNMVVDIGGGTTDIAVISLNGIVKSSSIKVAGVKFDNAIIKYVLNKYNILIGEKTTELAKKTITDLYNPTGENKIIVKGRHAIKGLPESVEITDLDVYEAIKPFIDEIVSAIKSVLEITPPELVGDIYNNGIIFTGGGALLKNLGKYVSSEIGVQSIIADDPLLCVAKGSGKAFEYADKLLDGFDNIAMYKY